MCDPLHDLHTVLASDSTLAGMPMAHCNYLERQRSFVTLVFIWDRERNCCIAGYAGRVCLANVRGCVAKNQ